jgi:hypothetical protein
MVKLLDEIEKESADSTGSDENNGSDKDNDGYPETPDKNAPPVTIGTSKDCTQSTYVECFYSRELLKINRKTQIDKKQLAALMLAIYMDLNKRSRDFDDQQNYDSPFWDAGGEAPGDACISGNCYSRAEVNYFAQGMYTAANGEPSYIGKAKVYIWKLRYGHLPSEGTKLWFDIGYMVFKTIAGK